MNGPGDISLTHPSSTPDNRPCSLISIIPTLGMSSCRGRAEAFARRLSSKLRTLGSQTDDEPISQEDEPIINGGMATNTWMTPHDSEQTVTDLQPLRHESDSFFDFDCDLESPGSPVDECEYLRLIETASNTPHNSAAESGYVCASAASSHSSSDGPYFDVINSECPVPTFSAGTQHPIARTTLAVSDLPEYVGALKINGSIDRLTNGIDDNADEGCHIEKDETNVLQSKKGTQSNHATKALPALPITGPDVQPPINEALQNHIEFSDMDVMSVQDQIISELHKQSEELQKHLELQPNPKTETNVQVQIISELQKHNEELRNHITPSNTTEEVNIQDQIISELQKQSEEIQNHIQLSNTTEEINVQDQIISELQKQSEIYIATETPAESSAITHEVLHTITNGHAENGEEVLKIEVSETDKEIPLTLTTSNDAIEVADTTTPAESITTQSKVDEKSKSSQLTGMDTTDDEDDCRPQRVRRCSSLKTGKTPPGTPGRKKIVRFADVLGLDLADVKTFLDEIPTIPKSAFEDLEIMESEPPLQLGPRSDKLLMPLFQQPGGLSTFLDLVREKQVSLENAAVTDHINQTITGSVRVRNLDFHKSVHIRYTIDGWRSFADLQANYVKNSCDGFSDKFTFILFGNSMNIGQRLEFAVRFQCKGQQFWDSNYGSNYCFQCLPTSTSAITSIPTVLPQRHTTHLIGPMSPSVGEAWCSSFY